MFFKKINVYPLLRERESESESESEREEGRGRERGRQILKQTPGSELSAQRPIRGSNSLTTRS